MRTVGIGAKKAPSDNVEELKKEIKSLKSSNTKLTKKVEELEADNEELTKKVEELSKAE